MNRPTCRKTDMMVLFVAPSVRRTPTDGRFSSTSIAIDDTRFSAATKMISEIVANMTIFSSRSARKSGRLISFHVFTCTLVNFAATCG